MKPTILAVSILALLGACQLSKNDTGSAPDRNLTVGTVQKEIRVGMAGSQVVEALGSPNIVTTDENRLEVWVYERYAREVQTAGNGYFLIFAFGNAEAARSSTRTLTVVVKFDAEHKVRDFAYHASTF